jgi:hypothetical protein
MKFDGIYTISVHGNGNLSVMSMYSELVYSDMWWIII